MTDEIFFAEKNGWGIIALDRPKALNALTRGMITAFHKQLTLWAVDSSIHAVMIKGAGDRAFCAGGDIRWLHDTAKEDPALASEFFREEYINNVAIYHFPKPFVALIDGIVMGGGVGVSVHGDFRVAGDNTLFAMPETGIGLFPDVGGGHFMPRLEDGLGLYYALTGARAKAADCVASGIATHYTPTDQFGALESDLLAAEIENDASSIINSVLDKHNVHPGRADIDDVRPAISSFFAKAESLEQLLDAFQKDDSEFAVKILEVLSRMSPTSMAITFEQMKRGKSLSFNEVMQMEFRIVCRILEGKDFFEGVRAQILDKDRNPQWVPSRLIDVSEEDVLNYFENLGGSELILN